MGRFDKYKGKTTNEEKQSSAVGEIALLKTQEQYNLQFIKVTKLIKSQFNKFDEYKESKPEKYEEIKNSIKEYGILNPLKVVLNSQGLYEVLGGWNRTQMIKELIDEGNTQFLDGIPCYVLNNISEIDQQIIAEIDNTGEGHTEPQEVRESIARLSILYQKKNEETGTNKSIVKQISQETGLGERQVQRYNSINKKLLPELQTYFDNKQISVENGAKLADLSEDGQKLILELLQKSDEDKKVTANEIKVAKEQSQKIEQEYQRNLKEKEEKEKELQEQIKNLEIQKEEEIQELLLKLQDQEEKLKKQLENLKTNEEQEELQEELQLQIEELIAEKEKLSNEKLSFEEKMKNIEEDLKKDFQKKSEDKEKEIQNLKKEIQTLSENLSKKNEETPKLTKEELEKIEKEIKVKETISQLKNLHKVLESLVKDGDWKEELQEVKRLFNTL